MRARDTTTHLVAGGVGGTVGAIVTCPLEVVKTRLQSSASGFGSPGTATSVWRCLRQVWALEGLPGLFRGLGPNLVGVAPSRAIYFWAYSSCKASLNSGRLLGAPDTPAVHVTAAATAGVISSISTNPIWVVKTRLQLDREVRPTSLGSVVRQVYREGGLRAFYLGLTASFYGTSETVVHFVVYEHLRARVAGWLGGEGQDLRHFLGFMACGAASKTGATCLAYPHEVVRTRLRERGTKYRSFWQTLVLVYREEGRPGLYRGLATNLIRQIPNTAVMMATYELTVHLLHRHRATL